MPTLRSPPIAFALLAAVAASSGLVSCALDPATKAPAILSSDQRTAGVLDLTDTESFERLLDDAGRRRILYLGEIHDRYDHHVNQLQVIQGLQARGHDLAIGLEAFQRPFQRHLDDYVAGRIDERDMLRRTEYYERWRFDYRLYRDILRFARKHDIPLVALNAPTELVESVSNKGIAGLDPAQKTRLPAHIAPADAAYRKRLRRAFAMHGDLPEDRFKRFLEVQSVWDAYMANEAAGYLAQHPNKTLAVLVGSAHVLHASAIPERVQRRYPVSDTVIVTVPFQPLSGAEPDYILAARDIQLGPRGRTGMTLAGKQGRVLVADIRRGGAAEDAGVQTGDRILRIDGMPIARLADIRLALADNAPGDRLTLELERMQAGTAQIQTLTLTLL